MSTENQCPRRINVHGESMSTENQCPQRINIHRAVPVISSCNAECALQHVVKDHGLLLAAPVNTELKMSCGI